MRERVVTPEPRVDAAVEIAPEALLHTIVRSVPAILYRCRADDDGSTFFMSPQVEEALGYTVDEWLMQPDIWPEILHPDDRETVLEQWDRCREQRTIFDAEYRMIGADGRRVWFHDRAQPFEDEDGAVCFDGVMVDITAARAREERLEQERFILQGTVDMQEERIAEANALMDLEVAERHAVEDDLLRAEERLAALRRAMRDSWLYTWKVVDGRATGGFNDEATLTEFGADPIEVEVRGDGYWRAFLHPADVERVWAKIRASTTTGVAFEDSYRWVTPDGRTRWIVDRAVPTRWDPARRDGHFVGLMVDVTDLMEGALSPEG